MKPSLTHSLSLALVILLSSPASAQQARRQTPPADPMRFDLICTVTASGVNGTKTDGTSISKMEVGGTVRHRIDLRAMRTCFGACSFPRNIMSVTADQIVIGDRRYITRSVDQKQYVNSFEVISRHSGNHRIESTFYESEYGGERGKMWADSTCMRAPFSGFPAARF